LRSGFARLCRRFSHHQRSPPCGSAREECGVRQKHFPHRAGFGNSRLIHVRGPCTKLCSKLRTNRRDRAPCSCSSVRILFAAAGSPRIELFSRETRERRIHAAPRILSMRARSRTRNCETEMKLEIQTANRLRQDSRAVAYRGYLTAESCVIPLRTPIIRTCLDPCCAPCESTLPLTATSISILFEGIVRSGTASGGEFTYVVRRPALCASFKFSSCNALDNWAKLNGPSFEHEEYPFQIGSLSLR